MFVFKFNKKKSNYLPTMSFVFICFDQITESRVQVKIAKLTPFNMAAFFFYKVLVLVNLVFNKLSSLTYILKKTILAVCAKHVTFLLYFNDSHSEPTIRQQIDYELAKLDFYVFINDDSTEILNRAFESSIPSEFYLYEENDSSRVIDDFYALSSFLVPDEHFYIKSQKRLMTVVTSLEVELFCCLLTTKEQLWQNLKANFITTINYPRKLAGQFFLVNIRKIKKFINLILKSWRVAKFIIYKTSYCVYALKARRF